MKLLIFVLSLITFLLGNYCRKFRNSYSSSYGSKDNFYLGFVTGIIMVVLCAFLII